MGSELTIAQDSICIGHRNLFLRFATPTLLRLCYLAPPLNTIQTLPHCLLVFLLQVTTNRISNSRHCQSDIYRLSYFAPLGIPFKRPLKNPQVLHVVLRVFFSGYLLLPTLPPLPFCHLDLRQAKCFQLEQENSILNSSKVEEGEKALQEEAMGR